MRGKELEGKVQRATDIATKTFLQHFKTIFLGLKPMQRETRECVHFYLRAEP